MYTLYNCFVLHRVGEKAPFPIFYFLYYMQHASWTLQRAVCSRPRREREYTGMHVSEMLPSNRKQRHDDKILKYEQTSTQEALASGRATATVFFSFVIKYLREILPCPSLLSTAQTLRSRGSFFKGKSMSFRVVRCRVFKREFYMAGNRRGETRNVRGGPRCSVYSP